MNGKNTYYVLVIDGMCENSIRDLFVTKSMNKMELYQELELSGSYENHIIMDYQELKTLKGYLSRDIRNAEEWRGYLYKRGKMESQYVNWNEEYKNFPDRWTNVGQQTAIRLLENSTKEKKKKYANFLE